MPPAPRSEGPEAGSSRPAAHCARGALGSLAELGRGATAVVAGVAGDDDLTRRLVAMGFWPGVQVQCLRRALFGDPLLFRLHGYRLALRRVEADRVAVEGVGT